MQTFSKYRISLAVAMAGMSRLYTGAGCAYSPSIVESILANNAVAESNSDPALSVQFGPASKQNEANALRVLSKSTAASNLMF